MIRVIFLTLMTGAVLAALSGCSPLKLLNTLNPTGPVDHVYGVAYGQDPRNTLDVYTPQTKPANAPVVVFFYGGSWNTGSKANYAFVGEALAARGMVVVIADYRLYPQVRYPSFLEDSAKALAWAHKHAKTYGGDPDRLYVMGHSAGAYNAAMLALDPRWLAREGLSPSILSGWIGLAGPYDFLPIENADVKPVFFFPDSPPDSQPINHVSSSAPPCVADGLEYGLAGQPQTQHRWPGAGIARGGCAGTRPVFLAHQSRHAGRRICQAVKRPGTGGRRGRHVRQSHPAKARGKEPCGLEDSVNEPAVPARQSPGNGAKAQAAQQGKSQKRQP